MTGRVEEGDAFPIIGFDLIGPDMLGNAPGFALSDTGFAQSIQKRGLAVINVTHDGDNRWPYNRIIFVVVSSDKAFFDVGFRNTADCMPEFTRHQLGRIGIDDIRQFQHHALLHQHLDDVDGADGHPVRQFLNRDDIGNDNFARRAGLIDG